MMKNLNDLQIGIAGEYLVCADLLLKGYKAFPSEQGMHYDVILDFNNKLYKIQVKTTREPLLVPQRVNDTKKYMFQVRRCGKGGRKSYQENDVDIFALVALDTKQIGYLKSVDTKQSMFFLPEGVIPVKDTTLQKNNIKTMRSKGYTFKQISEELNVDTAYAHRVCQGKQDKSFSRNYLSNYKIEECLKTTLR